MREVILRNLKRSPRDYAILPGAYEQRCSQAPDITERIRERPIRRCATSSLYPGYMIVAKKQGRQRQGLRQGLRRGGKRQAQTFAQGRSAQGLRGMQQPLSNQDMA